MITVTYDISNYRNLLRDIIRKGDTVVELGPHRGEATRMYMDRAGKAVLVDKGKDPLSRLTELAGEHENVVFVAGDARGFAAMTLALEHTKTCDVLAVDLGGGRFPDTVFKVWATWSGVFKPRDSVIRCRGLAEFLRRGQVKDDTLPDSFKDSGWLSEYGRETPANLKKQLEEFKHWIDIEKPLSDI
jgi:hypothetical protein